MADRCTYQPSAADRYLGGEGALLLELALAGDEEAARDLDELLADYLRETEGDG